MSKLKKNNIVKFPETKITDQEKEIIRKEFETKTVSHKAVVDAFCSLRGIKSDHKTLKGK